MNISKIRWSKILSPLLLASSYILLILFLGRPLSEFFKPRWDGVHYVSIAERGFELNPCGQELEKLGIKICGNPWFPGWSYWNKLTWLLCLKFFGLSIQQTFIFNSILAFLILCFVFFHWGNIFLAKSDSKKSSPSTLGYWSCIGLICQPASFYYLTAFPYTFLILTVTGYLFFSQIKKMRFQISSCALAMAASLSYPSAFLFGVFPFWNFLMEWKHPNIRKWFRLVLSGFVLFSGIFILGLIFKFQFGDFWLYFKHQAQYGRTFKNGFINLYQLLKEGHENERLTTLWYLLGWLIISLRLKNVLRQPSFYFFTLVMIFSFSAGSWMSIYRYFLLIAPIGVLIGASEITPFAKGGYFLLGLFFQIYELLPKYLRGDLI